MDLEEDSHIDMSSTNQWGIQAQMSQGNVTVLEILSSSTAAVGAYNMTIETSLRSNPGAVKKYKVKVPVYILFNPWCTGVNIIIVHDSLKVQYLDDLVHMPKEEELEEYIQNDTGKLWVGTYRQIRTRPWVFGQFEEAVLPAAMFVLDKSRIPLVDRGDPIMVKLEEFYLC